MVLLSGYIFFIHNQSEYVAGEYRYYTLYEEYQAKDKYADTITKTYNKDFYKLKFIKNSIIAESEVLDKYRKKLNTLNDSINFEYNTVPDFKRYVSNLKELKLQIDNQKGIILNFENQLAELYKYIYKIERNILSIKMYESDITNVYSVLKSIDSAAVKYNKSLSFIQSITELKGLLLEKKILEENEIERQNQIAKINNEIELENKNNNTYSDNKSNTYVTDYTNYEYPKSYDLRNIDYSINDYPSISNFSNSIYSTNTNPNVEQVKGHFKSNWTYVDQYERTVKNSTETDNFSFYGNLNPNTGKIGTKR